LLADQTAELDPADLKAKLTAELEANLTTKLNTSELKAKLAA
jgi:hypothetical protein